MPSGYNFPIEIQERILRIFLAAERQYDRTTFILKTNLRLLWDYPNTISLPIQSDASAREKTERFLRDVEEFERVLCRCGFADIEDNLVKITNRGRHVTFCNIAHLSVSFEHLKACDEALVQQSLKCMKKTLKYLQIGCKSTQVDVVTSVAAWTINATRIETLRFNAVRDKVSNIRYSNRCS